MSLLNTVSVDEASGDVAKVYAQLNAAIGRVPNAFRLLSPSPTLLQQQVDFIGYYARHPRLSPALLACIRMLVSQGTSCRYCIDMNAGMLINLFGWSQEQVAAAQADPAAADLPDADKALLLFVLKTVREPLTVSAADLDALRARDWSDGDILDAANHGARMVAADLLLNAFQVDRD